MLSHASSDIFAKQWYDSRFPMPYGGIDVKSMDGDFCDRIGGKSVGEMAANFAVRAPLTPKTIPFFDEFKKRTEPLAGLHRVRRQRRGVHLCRSGQAAPRQHRRRRGHQGTREDQLRGHAGHIEFDETHDVKPGTPTSRARPAAGAVARRLQARGDLSRRNCAPPSSSIPTGSRSRPSDFGCRCIDA